MAEVEIMFLCSYDEQRSIVDNGNPEGLIKKHGRKNMEEVFENHKGTSMNINKMYGLFQTLILLKALYHGSWT